VKNIQPKGFPVVSTFENASNIRSSVTSSVAICLICFDGIATEEGTQFAEVLLSVNHSQGYCQPAVSSPGNKGMNEVNNTTPLSFRCSRNPRDEQSPSEADVHRHDVAAIFRVSTRSIQKWMSRGRLSSRSMPGRAKFLPQTLKVSFTRAARSAVSNRSQLTMSSFSPQEPHQNRSHRFGNESYISLRSNRSQRKH